MDEELIPTRGSLISRLKDLDNDASWQEFFNTYWRLIYGLARKAGLNDVEAQDVVQETVLSVARRMPGFRYDPSVASFKTWLHQIVKCRIADHFRRRAREVPIAAPATQTGTAPLERIADPANPALDEAWDREWEKNLYDAAVERVRRKAGPEQFQIYEYHVLRERSVKETARDLGVSTGRVYLAKHRIGRMLKKEIKALRARPLQDNPLGGLR